jgi:hypothetical protein
MVIPMGGAILPWVTRMGIMVIIDQGIFHPSTDLTGGPIEVIVHRIVIVATVNGAMAKTYMNAMQGQVRRTVMLCQTTVKAIRLTGIEMI